MHPQLSASDCWTEFCIFARAFKAVTQKNVPFLLKATFCAPTLVSVRYPNISQTVKFHNIQQLNEPKSINTLNVVLIMDLTSTTVSSTVTERRRCNASIYLYNFSTELVASSIWKEPENNFPCLTPFISASSPSPRLAMGTSRPRSGLPSC